ncbi:tripartite ATP-independent transporter solute receptor, DctP family [Pseudobutyrivibrio sp. UC1225]|uniref:TRAP transporter substrate-binding protein n=1 Tax=Pseudobutyrivibrio sp. UC1225 TaxID=1798185 RepID=UPI0008E430A0|nr:TRAP transporter substrate-binding protein [Pseudobutyrivibrio sp. UC1225]SFN53289.1 tripartite ATP-independent transporter solute receptor, DctP family [Pseudobutyrivibrio sp. UC1225]
MKFKRIIALSTIFISALSLCSCGKSSEVQTYAWPLGTSSPEDTVTQIYAEKFAEEVYRLSDGQMVIQVYPNSVLGGDRELLESCKDGDIPFVVQNTAPQVTFLPDVAIFDMPCMFGTIDQVRSKVDDPKFMTEISQVYLDGGYQLLGYADQGFRVMTTNKPVKTINDFKGQKIRTMENSYHLDFWKALSASPTPMTFSEVYIGLQQGTIDAQENPYEVIVSNRLYEQQDYVIETNHLPHLISLIVSDDFMNERTPEEQEILKEAAATATKYARQQSDDRIASRVATIEESGTQIIPLSDEMRNEIQKLSKPVYDNIKSNVAPELYNIYTEGILKN